MVEELDDLEVGRVPDFLRDPLGVIRRHKVWMAIALLFGVAATLVYVATKKPYYVAKATILVTTQQIPEDFVQATVVENSLQRVNAMLGEVLSRQRLVSLVEKYDLYSELKDSHTLAEIVDLTRGDIEIRSEPGLGPRVRNERAQVLGISFSHADPEIASAMANDLAGLFMVESIRSRTQQARLTTEFLRAELVRAEKSLRDQNRAITEFREGYRGELPSDLRANLGRLDRLQQQRQSLEHQITQNETQLAMLAAGVDPNSPEGRLASLQAQLREALGVWTEEHPEVASLRRRIGEVEAEIDRLALGGYATRSSRPVLFAAAQKNLAKLRQSVAETESEIRQLDTRVERTPARAEELAALEERESVLRETYLEFLRKVQDAELAESMESAQQGERFSILDRAEPPTQPATKRRKHLVAGFLGSLLLSLAIGFAREALDPVFVTAEQVTRATDIPVLGAAPHIV